MNPDNVRQPLAQRKELPDRLLSRRKAG